MLLVKLVLLLGLLTRKCCCLVPISSSVHQVVMSFRAKTVGL